MENLSKAIIQVMQEVKGIEKNTQVGSGNFGYKGVSDADVKRIIGGAMAKAGLAILPIDIDAKTTIERWSEENTYNGITTEKQKQLVFTEVTAKYLLVHESGESQTVCGYGHGTDAMDKAAGKATTYSLKNTLLYLFLIPTGDIDDTDKTHSNEIEVPKNKAPKRTANGDVIRATPEAEKKWLNKVDGQKNFTKDWLNLITKINAGKITNLKQVQLHYKVSTETQTEIQNLINSNIKAA